MQTNQARCNTLRKLTGILALALLTTVTTRVATADVYTDPVGFITLTAVGTNGLGAGPLSYWGLGMTQIPTNRGYVATVSGTQVAISNQTLTVGAYNRVTAPVTNAAYFIEVTSGPRTGLMSDIVSNDAANVYTAEILPASSAGQTFKIYPHWTIAKVFGAANDAGLKPGTTTSADQIVLPNPVTQGFDSYYYATSSKTITAGWKGTTTANIDQSATTLYIDQGILIKKVTDTNLTYKLVGAVKLGNTTSPLVTANNFVGNVYASSSNTLATSGLYNGGNQSNSFVAGTTTSADIIQIHNDTTGAYNAYYYATSSKTITAGWKGTTTANIDQSNVQIPLGASVLIQIKSPRPGFDWTPPVPYTP